MTAAIGIFVWVVIATLAVLSAQFYARRFFEVLTDGGKVRNADFGPPEFGVACALSAWFAWAVVAGSARPARAVAIEDLLSGTLLLGAVAIAVVVFLSVRGHQVARMFGLAVERPAVLALRGVGLLLAALPLIILAGAVTAIGQGGQGEMQEVVTFFRDRSRESDTRAIVTMMLVAGVAAPVLEETIFRGFLYAAFKRVAGPAFAIVFSAGLFAAIHLNAMAFPALFVFAICLVLSYELTGSLLVPIVMHALFNLGNLTVLHVLSRLNSSP